MVKKTRFKKVYSEFPYVFYSAKRGRREVTIKRQKLFDTRARRVRSYYEVAKGKRVIAKGLRRKQAYMRARRYLKK